MSYLAENKSHSVLNSGLCLVRQLSGDNVSSITKLENKLFLAFFNNRNYMPRGVLTV